MKDRGGSRGGLQSVVELERLEPRVLLSVSIDIDYRFDTLDFFGDPARRAVVEAVADDLSAVLQDSLAAIIPGGPNEWSLRFNNPSTGELAELDNPTIEEDQLLVFVGGRDLGGDTLGAGGAGGWVASGTSSFLNLVEGRGQSGATGPESGQTDTSLWGGSMVFDTDTNWHFGLTTEGLDGTEFDFYSVALHELVHVLGFSESTPAYMNLVSPSGEFLGANSMAVSDDTSLLPGDFGHWNEGLESAGQEVLMDPTFSRGIRKLATPLDFASMQDIGWELTPDRWPGRGERISLNPVSGAGMDSGTAEPGSPGLHWIDPRQAGLVDFRVTSDEPVTLRLWDSRGRLVETNLVSDTVTGITLSATDQTYSIEVITSSATASYSLAVSTSGFDEVAFYPEGFASPEIDQSVTISNPTSSAQLFTLVVRYERGDLGRDFDVIAFERTIDPGTSQTIDIVDEGVLATDEPSGRSILSSQPYAIVLESTAPLGAALEHEDEFSGRDITTAESFTTVLRDEWTFAGAQKAAGVFDFVVFYNPNDHDALVTITFQSFDGQLRLGQEVRAGARGGLNLQDIAALADGVYGVTVQSAALDPADQPSHDGIVAAQTRFDGNTGEGWTALGLADPLPASGMIPLADLPGADVQASVYNPGTSTITLQFTLITETGEEPQSNRFVPAGTSATISVPTGIGYRYTFVGGDGVIQFIQSGTGGDSDATVLAFALTDFDDDPGATLRLTASNDTADDATVTVRFLFASGAEVTRSITVAGMDFETLAIETITEVATRADDGPLSIIVESDAPLRALLAFQEGNEAWASAGMVLPA